jgi:hypothetical protein
MKLLEHLHGSGTVTVETGDEVRVKYDVRITRDEPGPQAGAAPVAGFKHLEGQVWSENDPYFVLGNLRKTMMLRMEDGRRFKFFHRDIDGNIGLNEWIG